MSGTYCKGSLNKSITTSTESITATPLHKIMGTEHSRTTMKARSASSALVTNMSKRCRTSPVTPTPNATDGVGFLLSNKCTRNAAA